MAFFGVTVETIDTVSPIPNADQIEKATLVGKTFEFVIRKGSFKTGDRVLYFPIDSLIPQNYLEKLGLGGKLAGPNKDRVKTVRLRGQISQGIVADVGLINDLPEPWTTESITNHIGVSKWEPPIVMSKNANLLPLPEGQSVYDIEGADRYPEILNLLLGVCGGVHISEKVEGMNGSVTVFRDGTIHYCQRRYSIQEKEGEAPHTLCETVRKSGLVELAKTYLVGSGEHGITIYFELVGPSIQSNIYQINKPRLYIFDIKTWRNDAPNYFWSAVATQQAVERSLRENVVDGSIVNAAPTIYTGPLDQWLDGRTVVSASHGKSLINPNSLREGIVIKPLLAEQYVPDFGRLILKQRDPIYLEKTGL